jgi:HAD superfamily hydrolase (TIGR01509 family)
MRFLISFLLLSFSMCFSSIPDGEPLQRRPIIVFDFGGVIGGSDIVVVAKSIAPLLDLSQGEALLVLEQLRMSKDLGISLEKFWKEYESASGKRLSENWVEQFEQIRLLAIRAKPQMLQFVDRLRQRGYQVAMLSNTTVPRATFIRKQGFYHHFEPVVLSCEIGVKKPHQEAFVVLLRQLCASADDCIMVDDHPENIEAARRLGIDGILFTSLDELSLELEKRGISCSADIPLL